MNFLRFLTYAVLLGAGSLAQGEEFTAKIIAVLDGDTVLVRHAGDLVKIRLAEIDAPEKAQTFGETSKRSLADMVLSRQVQVESHAVDQYGRMVAHLSINGLDINAEQIRRGMAWEYSHFHSNHALIALQEKARQEMRGLWAQGDPIPPWEWRKQHPRSDAGHHASITQKTSTDLTCGNKKYCSQMQSCAEARFYFERCGIKSLDGDSDGTPCERLCAPAKVKN